MFGKKSKSAKESKSAKMTKSAKNVEASKEAKGCDSKSNSSAKNCKQFSTKKVHLKWTFFILPQAVLFCTYLLKVFGMKV